MRGTRCAILAAICFFASVQAALPQGQDDDKAVARRLGAISYKLERWYYAALEHRRNECPTTGGRWEDVTLPPAMAEAFKRSPRGIGRFHSKKMMLCDGAHIALAALKKIDGLGHPEAKTLYVFVAAFPDPDGATVDLGRYRGRLIGPFEADNDCEQWQQTFREHGLATTPCEVFPLKPFEGAHLPPP
jgi:hypothetical protein